MSARGARPEAVKLIELGDRRKGMQIVHVLHGLQNGRAAFQIEKDKKLYEYLNKEGYMDQEVGIAKSHWTDNAVWDYASSIAAVEVEHAKRDIAAARFLSLSLDESTAVDTSSLMSLHLYTIDTTTWERRHIFVKLADITDAPNASHLVDVLHLALKDAFDISPDVLKRKLVSTGMDGASVMMGAFSGVGIRCLSGFERAGRHQRQPPSDNCGHPVDLPLPSRQGPHLGVPQRPRLQRQGVRSDSPGQEPTHAPP